jgi:hypothetical protein
MLDDETQLICLNKQKIQKQISHNAAAYGYLQRGGR